MATPVNLDSLRTAAKKFREQEAPYKARGDWHGLWLGCSALLIEQAVAELEMWRGAYGENGDRVEAENERLREALQKANDHPTAAFEIISLALGSEQKGKQK
jgi:hypothetical protein